jgi:hypothetical protein
VPDKTEKARRKDISRALREEHRRSVRESLPVSQDEMKALFDHLDLGLSDSECDHSLLHTLEFIRMRNLPEEKVIAWLESAGGFCDCESLDNAEQVFEDAVSEPRSHSPSSITAE